MRNLKLFILSTVFILGTISFSFSADDENLSIEEQENEQSMSDNSDNNSASSDDLTTIEEKTEVEVVEQYKGGTLKDVKLVSHSDSEDTITLILDKPTVAEIRVLNLPYRLFIDMPMPYRWQIPEENISELPVSVVQGFRYGNPAEGIFRVTVDLTRSSYIRRVYTKTLDNNDIRSREESSGLGYEFNIDISSNSKVGVSNLAGVNSIVFSNDKGILQEIVNIANEKEIVEKKLIRGKSVEVKIKNYLESVTYKKPEISDLSRNVRVFIDSGHGGRDPGAISSGNAIKEKDLSLLISKRLKQELEKNKEITVIMSRDDDYYVPLKDRILWAQHLGANIFISIHADNASSESDASGLSVYTLSEAASDIQTQTLANSENQSDLIAGVDLNNDDTEVNNILLSLSQRVKSNESIDLARSIVEQASKTTKVMPNPIKSAGFAVLKLPNTPSVLVELGFLSNSEDVLEFQKEYYPKKMAVTLAASIEYYLWKKGQLQNFPVDVTSRMNSYVDDDIAKAIEKTSSGQNIDTDVSKSN